MSAANIELNIEELVLYGFSPHDAFRIGQAVERELTRLIMERGLPAQWSDGVTIELQTLDLGSFQLPSSLPAWAVGSGLSKTLHRGLQKELSPTPPTQQNL